MVFVLVDPPPGAALPPTEPVPDAAGLAPLAELRELDAVPDPDASTADVSAASSLSSVAISAETLAWASEAALSAREQDGGVTDPLGVVVVGAVDLGGGVGPGCAAAVDAASWVLQTVVASARA
ncbi:MAG TPA: hypothetical protein VIC86_07900, partial [Acidimicrobiales bacterium]